MADEHGERLANVDWALQDRIADAAHAATDIGADDPAFAVSVVDVQAKTLTIFRKSIPSDTFDVKRYSTIVPAGVATAFRTAALSAVEIRQLGHLLEAMAPEFEAVGVHLHGWGPEYESGLQVTYSGADVPQSLVDKASIYGVGTMTFRRGEVRAIAELEHPGHFS